MAFSLSTKSLERMQGVNPKLQEIAKKAIELTTIDFGIPQFGGLRSAGDQLYLYQSGKSKADGINKKSYHQSGNALDVFAYVNGKASWDELHLAMVAAAMLQAASELGYAIEWGGLWKSFKDFPHFQIRDLGSQVR